jgi:hypothetical protein
MANSLTTASYIELSEMLKEEHNVTMLNPLSNDLATLTIFIVLWTRSNILSIVETVI